MILAFDTATPDTVVGVNEHDGADGGPQGFSVVRYKVSTGQVTTLATDPTAAPFDFVASTALVQ